MIIRGEPYLPKRKTLATLRSQATMQPDGIGQETLSRHGRLRVLLVAHSRSTWRKILAAALQLCCVKPLTYWCGAALGIESVGRENRAETANRYISDESVGRSQRRET